ncbi:hypothetical protein LNTAR_25065 [Lentisphaera araneosa HTCC2155]|uniref:Uncharacterized protein n=1 Tax=Lentisphaera araneosa HTCC2155 TaxID=313628 RepID=A6DRU0_9BACT|nr:DUF4405 domain-containing protein [Lentisphaera araneosa]EDM25625.1 hypothetical protein LNTAR_25065 [Lentisphaera araneosa HTCC2155]
MRHFVNIALLLCFATLAISGVMSYALPFDIDTARVHIVFGLATLILIGLHLIGKGKYFKAIFSSKSKISVPKKNLALIFIAWLGLLFASLKNAEPAKIILSQSYESRRAHEIVRPNPLIQSLSDKNNHNTTRLKEKNQQKALAIHLNFNHELKSTTALAIWAESKAGTLIETLYISPELAYSEKVKWNGKETERQKLLPIWRHRYTLLTGIDPDGELDLASGATSNHSFSLEKYLKTDGDEYALFVEIKEAGFDSVIYSTYVDHSEKKKYRLLEITGNSTPTENSPKGSINYDTENIKNTPLDLGLIESLN